MQETKKEGDLEPRRKKFKLNNIIYKKFTVIIYLVFSHYVKP